MTEVKKAKELEDLSGPFNPNLKFEDFSKEFLIKLMNLWQHAWLQLTTSWFETIEQEFGTDAANNCELKAWVDMSKKVNPRYAKMANIELKTVLDSLKALQLPLDNVMDGRLFSGHYDIKDPNHVIYTVVRCRSLEYMEKKRPDRIKPICHVIEPALFATYMINPKLKITPLKLPPRERWDDICCLWDIRIEE